MKLSFTQLTIELDRLWMHYEIEQAMQMYNAMIQACGWTDADYNAELLKLIDNNWETK